jgi:hypothetical protein
LIEEGMVLSGATDTPMMFDITPSFLTKTADTQKRRFTIKTSTAETISKATVTIKESTQSALQEQMRERTAKTSRLSLNPPTRANR